MSDLIQTAFGPIQDDLKTLLKVLRPSFGMPDDDKDLTWILLFILGWEF